MGFPAERTHFPRAHKTGAAISGPRIADKNYMDTRIFLIFLFSKAIFYKVPEKYPLKQG